MYYCYGLYQLPLIFAFHKWGNEAKLAIWQIWSVIIAMPITGLSFCENYTCRGVNSYLSMVAMTGSKYTFLSRCPSRLRLPWLDCIYWPLLSPRESTHLAGKLRKGSVGMCFGRKFCHVRPAAEIWPALCMTVPTQPWKAHFKMCACLCAPIYLYYLINMRAIKCTI